MTLTVEQRERLDRLASAPGENAKYLKAALDYIDWLEAEARRDAQASPTLESTPAGPLREKGGSVAGGNNFSNFSNR